MNYPSRHLFDNIAILFTVMMTAVLLLGCEAPMEETSPTTKKGNVTITVNSFDLVPFKDYYATSRATMSARDLCSRLTFAIFTEGIRVGNINQIITNKEFGTANLDLDAGTYKIVAIGYGGMGNATTTNAEKITFPSSHVSETFWACEEFTVDEGTTNIEINLKRIVACVHFHFTDAEIPETLKTIRCYYTGGSSTLNGFTGYGSVNSNQKEELALNSDNSFDIYTFPHYDSDVLDITVQAIDNNGDIIAEKAFQEVGIKMNYVTIYSGEFFADADKPDEKHSGTDITVKGDNAWAGKTEHTF